MVMTEARSEVSIMGEMVDVRCTALIVIRGETVTCNRLALRVTRDMLPLFPDNVVMTCDKCGEVIDFTSA